MGNVRTWRGGIREALLALLVLGLTFLNFGHQSAVFAAGGRVVVTAVSSICGDPINPSSGDHFACHACRPHALALPPAPVGVEPVCFAAEAVVYAAPAIAESPAETLTGSSPRGPPEAV